MPPSRCPRTTIGLSNNVTVHMPSMACKITTANATTATRHGGARPSRDAANSGNAIAASDIAADAAYACWM